MNGSNFPSHGSLNVSVDGSILTIEIEGPANTEFMEQYKTKVQPHREQLQSAPWASLVILKGEPLIPPEAKQVLVGSVNDAKKIGLSATAIILLNVEYENSIRQFWSQTFNQCNLPHKFFDDEITAKQWLYQQL